MKTVARPGDRFRGARTSFGAGVIAALIGLALGGCGDPSSDPSLASSSAEVDTLAAALSGAPTARAHAIERIAELHDAAQAGATRSGSAKELAALADRLVAPLVALCRASESSARERTVAVRLLAAARDPRGERCFQVALERYEPGAGETEAEEVVRATAAMRLSGLAPQLVRVLATLEPNERSRRLTEAVVDGLAALGSAASEDSLVAVLSRPVDLRYERASAEVFRFAAAAYVLGELRSEKAVRPLLAVLLKLDKTPVHAAAKMALTRIGAPAASAAMRLLNGEDEELGVLSMDARLAEIDKTFLGTYDDMRRAHTIVAADVLADVGGRRATPHLLEVIVRADDHRPSRVLIAAALSRVPHDDAAREMFRRVYQGLEVYDSFGSTIAKEAMIGHIVDFFDPESTPWLVRTSLELNDSGSAHLVGPLRQYAFKAALQLTTLAHSQDVERLSAKIAYPEEILSEDELRRFDKTLGQLFHHEWQQALDLLHRCREDAACFLTAATDARNQSAQNHFIAVKGITMFTILRGERGRGELVGAVPKVTHPAARATLLRAIEHLSPMGDVAAAAALESYARDTGDIFARMLEPSPLLWTAGRLRARAQ